MNDRERYDEMESIFEDLSEMCSTYTILIEGNRDRNALSLLNTEYDSIEVQREGGPLKAAERVYRGRKKAVILTDWDDRGNRIAEDLSIQLSALCIPYDTSIRSRLIGVCKADIKDVESIPALYRRLLALYG